MKSEIKKSSATFGAVTESISIGKTHLNLNFDIQISPNGRPIKLAGIRKNSKLPSKWVGKDEKWHWIYTFNYKDEQGGGIEVEIDYNDKFYQMLKFC